jgi:hypothetical protein
MVLIGEALMLQRTAVSSGDHLNYAGDCPERRFLIEVPDTFSEPFAGSNGDFG